MSSIEKYKLADGSIRWSVRWRDEQTGSNRRKKAFRTKREASLWASELDIKTAQGTWTDPRSGRIQVNDLAEGWLASTAPLKATTRNNLNSSLQVHVLPYWGHREIGAIRKTQVRTWIASKLDEGSSVSVLERALGILRQICDQAVEDQRIVANPCENVKVPRRVHTERGFLDHRQLEALAGATTTDLDATLIRFLGLSGLRWGEAAELRVKDFDTLRRRVSVTRAMAEVKGACVVSTPKSHETRSVPYPAFLAVELAALMEGRGREQLVFSVDGETYLRVSNWRRRVFYKALQVCRAEDPTIPEVTPHGLRHTAVALAISAGANIKSIQRMAGHYSAGFTLDRYGHLYEDDLEAVAVSLDDARRAAL